MEPDTSEDGKYIDAIKSAIGHGITHIDTAEVYGGGHTEELVGQGIADTDRSSLFITTKVGSDSMAGGYNAVMKAAEASLKRLKTDYIDLYLLHMFPKAPIEDVMRAMNDLMEQGIVKNIGVSNFTANRIQVAQQYTQFKVACNQVEYNLQAREAAGRGLVEYCQQNDMFLTAWGPLHKGILEHGDMLQELARKYAKTPYQVALNWVIAQPNVITIPKTTSAGHLEENLGTLGWELEPEDMAKLTNDFPDQEKVSGRVPLGYERDVPA